MGIRASTYQVQWSLVSKSVVCKSSKIGFNFQQSDINTDWNCKEGCSFLPILWHMLESWMMFAFTGIFHRTSYQLLWSGFGPFVTDMSMSPSCHFFRVIHCLIYNSIKANWTNTLFTFYLNHVIDMFSFRTHIPPGCHDCYFGTP